MPRLNCIRHPGHDCIAPQSCRAHGCIYPPGHSAATGSVPPKRQPWAKPEYAPPWYIEVYDERVFILARDGEKVLEVTPGQVDGRQLTLDERKALARRAVDAVNQIEVAALDELRRMASAGEPLIDVRREDR
jgi:hypothetical protein